MINSSLVTSKTTLPTVEGSVFKRLVVALMIGLQIAPIGLLQTYAQTAPIVVAPGTGQRPVVTLSGNGVPVVQIAPPTAGGVSVNTFNQFNVGTNGVVLNNSGANNQSQLGGWVAGNPMLGNNHARTILNQVTGSTGSALNGYIEASGNKANVVIANPNGITCDGCGFINIPNATLTTGQVQLGTNSAGQGGSITGVNVTQGVVIVNGKGMDASGVNQLDILTRSAQINANVWAGNNNPATNGGNNNTQLNVILGVNQIATDGNGSGSASNPNSSGNPTITSSNAANATAAAPTVALDVSNLGGMYAGAIRLIGTEAGLGVNSAGAIQATSSNLQLSNNGTVSFSSTANTQAKTDLTLTATQGNLNNAGSIVAGGNVQLQTNGANSTITNSGSIYAQGNTTLTANATSGTVNNTGFIGAQGNTSVNTAQFTQSATGTLAAGVATDGKLGTTGTATITSTVTNTGSAAPTQGIQNAGQIVAGKDVVLSSSAAISNQTGAMVSGNDAVTITTNPDNLANIITNAGTITANTGVTLNAANGAAAINNTSGNIQSAALTLTSNELNNTGGQLIQTGTGNLTLSAANGINNTNGLISSNATNLTLASNGAASSAINNTNGRIEAAGTGALNVTTTGVLTNTGANAAIVSNNTANLSTGAGISNTAGATVQAQTLVIATPTLNNNGGNLIQTGTASQSITLTGELSNVEGVIASNSANLTVNAQSINNQGGVVQHAGTGNLTVTATNELNNSASANAAGAIVGNNTVTVNAASINNTGLNASTPSRITATNALTITTTGNAGDTTASTSINNTQGLIAAGTALNLNTANTVNNAGGTVQAASLTVQAGNLNNTALVTSTGTGENTQAAQLIQTGSTGSASITTTGTLNNTGGVIASNAGLTVNSQNLTNTAVGSGVNATGGAIQSAGTASIKVAQTLDSSQGNIVAGKNILIESIALNNTQGVIQALTGTTVQAQTLNNQGGAIVAQGASALTINAAQNIDNTQGQLIGGNNLAAGSTPNSITTASFTNTDGVVYSAGNQTLNLGSLSNQTGTVQAGNTLVINGANGTSTAGATISNTQGGVIQAQQLAINAATLTNDAATIYQSGTGATPTTSAQIKTTGDISNTNGAVIASAGGLTIVSQGNVTNNAANIQAAQLSMGASDISNTNGASILQTGVAANPVTTPAAIITATGTLNNTGGIISSVSDLTVTGAQSLNNQGGTLYGGQSVTASTTGALTNTAGFVGSTGRASLTAGAGIVNTDGGTVQAQTIALTTPTFNNARGNLIQTGTADQTIVLAGALNNVEGNIASNAANLNITAQSINNAGGKIEAANAAGTLTMTSSGVLDNSATANGAASILANNNAIITVGSLTNNGTAAGANQYSRITAGNDLAITTNGAGTPANGNLTNTQGIIAATKALSVTATGTLTNAAANLQGNSLAVTAASLNNLNTAQIVQTGDASTAASPAAITTTGTLTNSATIVSYGSAVIVANTLSNSGLVQTFDNLTLTGQTVSNSAAILAGGASTINLTGDLNNNGGNISSNGNPASGSANGTSITAANITNDNSARITAMGGGNLTLTATGAGNTNNGNISNSNQSRLIATGDAALNAATVSNTGAAIIYSVGNTTLNTASLTNTASTIQADQTLAIGTGAASNAPASTVNQGRSVINNTAASLIQGAGLSIQANSIGNQASNIVQVGAGATSASNPASINTTGAVNNTDGTIAFAANSATITAASLDTTRGTVKLNAPAATVVAPTGDLTLAITNATINTAGSITSTGNVSLTTGTLTNTSQGNIQALDNLTVTSTQAGTATNPSINNTQGTLNAGQATTVTSAGALTNISGTIQAGTVLNVTTSGALSNGTLAGAGNPAGLITAQQVTINTNSNALDNSQGAIVSYIDALAGATNAATLRIDSGALTNDAGLIQSTGNATTLTPATAALSINTGNNTLTNANSGTSNGIISNGETLINTGTASLNNTGYIASNGALTITTAALNNTVTTRATNQSVINAADLTVTAGAVNNQNGSIQANNATFNLGTGTLDNQGTSLIAARNTLTINAATINNQGTQTATVAANDPSIAYGIEGNTVTLNAAGTPTASTGTVNNQGGAIRAANDLTLNAATLNNQAGLVSSSNNATITATNINNQTLNGQAGLLTAGNLLTVTTTNLDNTGGKIIGVKDAVITINNNYVHGASDTLKAGNNLTLNTQTLTNNGTLLAGNTLAVNASNITNSAAGEFNAANTHLNATGNIANYGLIDGGNTVLKAGGNIDNLGGRIYGDNIAIQANTLTNTVNTAGTAGVIAARQNLDIGAQTLNNVDGGSASTADNALIYSAGNINIGGALDANNKTTGSATTVNNLSSTIDAGGSINIAATTLNNTNRHFTTRIEPYGQATQTVLIRPDGSATQIPISNLVWENWSRAGQYRFSTNPASGTNYVLGQTPVPRVGEQSCTGEAPNEVCVTVNGSSYPATDPAWAYFNQTPPSPAPSQPTLTSPVAPDPARASNCTAGATYNATACTAYNTALNQYTTDLTAYDSAWATYTTTHTAWQSQTDARYEALDTAIETYNAPFANSVIRNFTQYNITRTEQRSVVDQTDPSKITAGGNLSIQASAVNNDKSQIVAGGTLNVQGATINNIQGQGVHLVHDEGTAQHTYERWRGGFKRYHERNWDAAVAYVADLPPQTITLSVATTQQNTAYTANGQTAAAQAATTVASTAQGTAAAAPKDLTLQAANGFTATVKTAAAINGETAGLAATLDAAAIKVIDAATVTIKSSTPYVDRVRTIDAVQGASARIARTPAPAIGTITQVNPPAGSTTLAIRTVQPNTQVPNNALFRVNTNPGQRYLIETDPRFADYKTWINSDVLIAALGQQPNNVLQRLGDGFYEQKLVQEQIIAATGQRFTGDYTSNEDQYKALLLSGAEFANSNKGLRLSLGVALTEAQMRNLTTDIVWLVEQTIQLPNGQTAQALVPQVYLRVKEGDLKGDGSLISGRDINLNLSGDLNNSGTIAGRNSTFISAENINNSAKDQNVRDANQALGGRITGNVISLTAKQDINNVGGQILGTQSAGQDASIAQLKAGRDINIATTTQSTSGDTRNNAGVGTLATRTAIDQVGTIQAGNVAMFAGRDLTIAGASVSATSGNLILSADRNIKLATVQTAEQTNINFGSNRAGGNTLNQGSTTQVGSQLGAAGQVYISAGRQAAPAVAATYNPDGSINTAAVDAQARTTGNVSSTGASIAAGANGQGQVTINATGNIELLAAKNTSNFAQEVSSAKSGFLSKSSSNVKTATQTSESAGTTISGSAISLNAGIGAPRDLSGATGNITAQGANLVADGDISIRATNNVTLTTAANTESSQSSSQTKKSGFTAMQGGINVGYSASKTNTAGNSSEVTNTGTLVGSLEGNVTITAGNQYTQTGSAIVTPTGDITIQAKKVDINEARNTYSGQSTQSSKQSGITVGLSGGVINSVQSAYNATAAATSGGGNRNQTLNALTAYAKGSDAMEQGKDGMNAMQNGGSMAQGAAAAGVKLTVSVGTSQSSSASSTVSNTASGSTVKSGGSVSITATDSDITVQGSSINAAQNTSLDAKQNINLLASADLESNRSSNKSSSTSVGVSLGAGGLTLDVAASRGKGAANSDATTYNNTQVGAGNTLTIKSGGDTNIKGATATGTQVNATIGGNLNIQSLQDTATSAAQQKTTGVSLSIPITGAGQFSASVSQSKQSSNSTYQSVNQQSGIQAGSADGKTGGFNINVAGNTDLKGAVIASTAAPTQNTLNTQTLTTSDLQNTMTASASSSGINLSTSMASGKYEAVKGAIGNAMNRGSAKDSDAGTTTSAIAAGQITVGAAGSTSNPLTTTDTSKTPLVDSNGKTVSTNTANASTPVRQANVQALQAQAGKKQADNNLLVSTVTSLTDPAYKAMFQQGAKMYRVPPGCSSQACAIELSADDIKKLDPSQDGKVHIANNGIFNDVDGAVKYAQQHGGVINPDGSKDVTTKPTNQYIVFAPQSNNIISEMMIAGYQKYLSPTLGLTVPEQANVNLINQTAQQGQRVVFDNHSRGTLTNDNAMGAVNQSIQTNQSNTNNPSSTTTTPTYNLTVNNYGSAANIPAANQNLQQLTGNQNAQINSVIHPQDIVGTNGLSGNNTATPTYTTTSANGTVTTVTATNDGIGTLGNAANVMTGSATPHSCYGTAIDVNCGQYWNNNVPTSNSSPITTTAPAKQPTSSGAQSTVSAITAMPAIPSNDQVQQLQQHTQQHNAQQMNQVQQPTSALPTTNTPPKPASVKIQQLLDFMNTK